MNNTLRNMLIVFAVLVLAVGIFFAGGMFARATSFSPGWMMGGYDWNTNGTRLGGMMGGVGGYGPGGMMGGNAYSNAAPLTIDVSACHAAITSRIACCTRRLAKMDIPGGLGSKLRCSAPR